jgi:hypothetical protein
VVERYTIRNMVNGFTNILLTELDARDARRARAPLPFHS